MAKKNLNLVLTNRFVVTTTKLGCDAVAKNSGRGMPPTLSQWQHVLPRFTPAEPPYANIAYEEPAKRMATSEVNRLGSPVFSFGRMASGWDTSIAGQFACLNIVSDKDLSERGEQHRPQHDHDYPSQDRHDDLQNREPGQQPRIGLVFNTGKRK